MANILGGDGNDTLVGTRASDRMYGFFGSDSLRGAAGNDTLNGGDGDDFLDGGLGNDLLRGGAGNDYYFINSIGDRVDEQGATSTTDRVISTISLNLNILGAGLIENAQVMGKTNLSCVGNAKANSIVGNIGHNTLSGGGGNDTLLGISGNDRLVGGAGDDILNGGVGNNVLVGGKGNDSYFYNGISDKIDEQGATSLGDRVNSSISVNLNTLAAGLIEHVFLVGSANLFVTGNAAANIMTGNAGANTLNGANGNDALTGGLGDDRLNGGAGNDVLDGGIDATGNSAANAITGNSGNNTIQGGGGNDTLSGEGSSDKLQGNAGDDSLLGGASGDVLQGGDGNDTLTGGDGEDLGIGGKGNDTIHLTSDLSATDIYSYEAGDLDGGAVDTFQGTMDSRILFTVGDDIIDIGDVIVLDNGVVARDEISDFITKSSDGLGGVNYSIDLDGGEATFSPVQFLHFVQTQLPVWFQADNEQQAI